MARWCLALLAALVPLGLAVASPLLAGREAVYVAGGLAGVAGLSLMLLQPALIARWLPTRRPAVWHGTVGILLLLAVLGHVLGLYLDSPDDVMSVLMLDAPTPFSTWGLAGLVGVVLTVALPLARGALPLGYRAWRLVHSVLALGVVGATVAHAMLIEGAMEPITKALLCAAVMGITLAAVITVNRPPRRPA